MATVTLRGNPIQLSGHLPAVGSKAPNFQLVDRDLKRRTLISDFQGVHRFLYIVPSLDTERCLLTTKELNEKAKKYPSTSFLVISCDLPFAQKRICALEGIDKVTPLSMMESKDFARDYGILITEGPLEGLCARAVIIIDEDNQVVYSELVPEITLEPNFDQALQALSKI